MDTVRIGLIGAGWVARNRHLPALKKIPGAKVEVIWSRKPENARKAATEFQIPRTTRHWEKVAASPNVDAVIVATPPVLHLPATLAALQRGKHVLCQGRMARNLNEAQQMVAAAKTSNLIAALYPPRPGLKGDRVMRRLLHKEHFLGQIREVRVTGLELTPDSQGYSWTSDPEVVGVHAMTMGMWAEVANRWVGPAVRLLSMASPAGYDRGYGDVRVPNSLVVGAELKCGALVSYHLSTFAAAGPGHSIEIYGSKGGLVYHLFAEEISGGGAGESLRPIPISPEEERFQDTDEQFVRAIRDGGDVSPDFDEGLQYMEFCEAVALSSRLGAMVPVPTPRPMMESWGRFLL